MLLQSFSAAFALPACSAGRRRWLPGLLVSTLLLLSLSICAQNYSGIGVSLFPNWSGRRLVALDANSVAQVDSLDALEGLRPAYSAGFFLSYRGKRAGVQAGLQYTEVGYNGERRPITFDDPEAPNFTERAQNFRSRQVEIPLSVLMYQPLGDKDDFYFLMGTSLSYNLSNEDLTVLYAGDISERRTAEAPQDFRRLNYAFQTAMGWEHRFRGRIVMNVAPTFKLWLAGLYRDEAFLNRNIYQFGLRVAFRLDRELVYE
jgi:hypothetical protein